VEGIIPNLSFRYTMAGMASATGLVLLSLAVFSNPAAILAQIQFSRAVSGDPAGENAGLIVERDIPQQERTTLQQQLVDLTSQIIQLRTELAIARNRIELPPTAPFTTPANGAPTVIPTGTLRERLELVETCLVEARQQEAGLLLESILFQLTFRPAPGEDNQATASMIRQALAAVAAADLEKAAFDTEQARPNL
jgi:hypothetical protein